MPQEKFQHVKNAIDMGNKLFLKAVRAYLTAKQEHEKADKMNRTFSDDSTFIQRALVKKTVGSFCNQRCEKLRSQLAEKKQALVELLENKPELISAITTRACCTAFHYAVEKQDVDLLILLLDVLNKMEQEASIPDSIHFHNGINPLMLAIALNNDTMVELFLKNDTLRKAWLNNINRKQQTPFHLAIVKGISQTKGAEATKKNKRIINMLIEHQAEFGDNPDHNTPLHLAARNGKIEVIATLIKQGYEVNAQNAKGDTPLHIALRNRHVKTAKLLANNGADISLNNEKNQTAIEVGQATMKQTRWWQSMVEGGFGESACPMEATSGIIGLIAAQFAQLNLLPRLMLGIASFATLGVALVGVGIVFLINGYTQKRMNYGESAQGALATMLEANVAESKASVIAKDIQDIALLRKKVRQAKLLGQPLSKEDIQLIQHLQKKEQQIKEVFESLPDRPLIPESWKLMDPLGGPSLEKQRLYATTKDKRAAMIGGIGKGLGTGSALASVFFTGLAIVGFFTAPTIVGAVIMAIGIAGVIALSGAVAANSYQMAKEEYGLQNQRYHRQMHRIDEIYDTLFEGINKDNLNDTFLDLNSALKPSTAPSLKESLKAQAQQYSIDLDTVAFPADIDRIESPSWQDRLTLAVELEAILKTKTQPEEFERTVSSARHTLEKGIDEHDLGLIKKTLLLSPSCMGSEETFSQLILKAIQLNQDDTVELLLNAYPIQTYHPLKSNLLHQMVQLNNQTMVEAILRTPLGENLANLTDEYGKSPLHYAAELTIPIKDALPKRKANYAIAKALLDAGANPSQTTPDNNTAFHLAAKGFIPIDKMTKHSQNIQSVIYDRSYNAQRDKSALLRMFCQRSSNIAAVINLRNDAGDTPIHRAVKNKNHASAMVLAEFGADYHLVDTKKKVSALKMGKTKIANNRWKSAMLDSIGEASCPVETSVTVTSLMVEKLKSLSVMSVLGLTILSIATLGITLAGAAVIFFASAYKDKQVNYGEEAQNAFELQMIKAKVAGIADMRTKLERKIKALSEDISAYDSLDKVPMPLRQKYEQLNKRRAEYNSEIIEIKKLSATIPDEWQFDPNAEENSEVLRQYASNQNKIVASISAIGKSLGVGSAVAGTTIALLSGVLGLIGTGAALSVFGVGIPILTIGIVASIALAVGVAVAVGYFAYRSTKQEFGEMHQKNHRLMLASNKIIDKRITPLVTMKPIEAFFDNTSNPDQRADQYKEPIKAIKDTIPEPEAAPKAIPDNTNDTPDSFADPELSNK